MELTCTNPKCHCKTPAPAIKDITKANMPDMSPVEKQCLQTINNAVILIEFQSIEISNLRDALNVLIISHNQAYPNEQVMLDSCDDGSEYLLFTGLGTDDILEVKQAITIKPPKQ